MLDIVVVLSLLWAFFLGSIPTGYILGKIKGSDIRDFGSGNIGAANAFRTFGKLIGILVLAFDIFKGWLAVSIIYKLAFTLFITDYDPNLFKSLLGIAVIAGHIWTPFLKFKGGKGVATAFGVMIAMDFTLAAIGFGAFLITLIATRYISASSLIAMLTILALSISFAFPRAVILLTIFIFIAIWIKHLPNISQILKGIERKLILFKKKPRS
ncbi:MAG: glycerol-3-phosphate 1-O-acyltransferase PlsY [Patescibacteria group bacterium]|nr:glycerol-3-phosphate 1-O-acyltransferase PlsY [Patescibacteria group bacterium]